MSNLGGRPMSENTDSQERDLRATNAPLDMTLAEATSNTLILAGDAITISDRGNGTFDVITGTGTADTFGIIAHGTLNVSLSLRLESGVRYADNFGAADGIADSFGAIDAAIRSLPEGGIVYLPEGDLNIGTNTIRDDVLTPTTVGKTITLIGVGASEDQGVSGKITTINTTGGTIGISFNGNRSGGHDFAVKGDNGSQATSVANIVVESSRAQWFNIVSEESRGSGINFVFGNNSYFAHITCIRNNFHGFDADGTGYVFPGGGARPNDLNASVFINIDVRSNANIGFRTGVNSGFSNFYYNITAQGNRAEGLEVNGDFNRFFGFYGEANGGDTATAGSFEIGFEYEILTVGTTDYTLIGSANNNVGTRFVTTGIGAGTGTAFISLDILFSGTADNNEVWGEFSNASLSGATFHKDLSTNQRNYIKRLKTKTEILEVDTIDIGEDKDPAGFLRLSGQGDDTNRQFTLEGTSGSQIFEMFSSGAGTFKPDFKDGIVVSAVTAPTLLNSWANFGSTRRVAGFYTDPFDVTHLEGVIDGGTTTNPTALFILPTGARPSKRERFATTANGDDASLFIDPDGTVSYESGSNVEFSLSGISFRAA